MHFNHCQKTIIKRRRRRNKKKKKELTKREKKMCVGFYKNEQCLYFDLKFIKRIYLKN